MKQTAWYLMHLSPQNLSSFFLSTLQHHPCRQLQELIIDRITQATILHTLIRETLPWNTHQKKFTSTKCRIVHELQTKFRNKAIKNLSSYQLSRTETEVLALALKFVPTPPASMQYLVRKSATRFIQTMKKQFHFRNQPLTVKHPTYWKPSTWIPPGINSANLTLFLE